LRRTLIALSVALAFTPPLAALEASAPPVAPILAPRPTDKPDAALLKLDGELGKALADRQAGRLDAAKYAKFLNDFRAKLDRTRTDLPPTPANIAFRARLLSRLGDLKGAQTTLAPALAAHPKDAGLRLAMADLRYRQKDYAAALIEAEAVLKRDPGNTAALTLKHFSEGRVANGGEEHAGPTSVETANAPDAAGAAHAIDAMKRAKAAMRAGNGEEAVRWARAAVRAHPTPAVVDFARKVERIVKDNPVMPNSTTPETPSRGMPLWPVGAGFGLGALGYAVAKKSSTQVSEEGLDEEHPPRAGRGQRFVAGAVLAGMAGAGIFLAGSYLVAAAPAVLEAAPIMGRRAVRQLQSETGAVRLHAASVAEAESPAAEDVLAEIPRAGRLVIGRGADLAKPGALQPGEVKLTWPTKLPDFKSELNMNLRLLREWMAKGFPIRDASNPNDTNGIFLNAERIFLRGRGWEFDEATKLWTPPRR
jgi:tetratricopeptide (TPR) repeat protein